MKEANIHITKLKCKYNRQRPYQFAKEWDDSFEAMPSVSADSPAYPSGHTIQAWLASTYLSELAPQPRRELMDLAHEISWSRVLGGYHWPSDSAYGKDIFRHIVLPKMPASIRLAAEQTSLKAKWDEPFVPLLDEDGTLMRV